MVWERGIECAKQSDTFTTFYFNDKIRLVDCSPYGTLPFLGIITPTVMESYECEVNVPR